MNKELKPCPFCGNESPLGSILLQRYHIFCARCQARGPEGKTLEAASAAWNRRATVNQPDLLPCPKCGYPHPVTHCFEPSNKDHGPSYQVDCPKCGEIGLPANNEAGAIELWNRLHDSPALAALRKEAGK